LSWLVLAGLIVRAALVVFWNPAMTEVRCPDLDAAVADHEARGFRVEIIVPADEENLLQPCHASAHPRRHLRSPWRRLRPEMRWQTAPG
jgi:hypothetical protein